CHAHADRRRVEEIDRVAHPSVAIAAYADTANDLDPLAVDGLREHPFIDRGTALAILEKGSRKDRIKARLAPLPRHDGNQPRADCALAVEVAEKRVDVDRLLGIEHVAVDFKEALAERTVVDHRVDVAVRQPARRADKSRRIDRLPLRLGAVALEITAAVDDRKTIEPDPDAASASVRVSTPCTAPMMSISSPRCQSPVAPCPDELAV